MPIVGCNHFFHSSINMLTGESLIWEGESYDKKNLAWLQKWKRGITFNMPIVFDWLLDIQISQPTMIEVKFQKLNKTILQ